mgnify:CR=1 FL=1
MKKITLLLSAMLFAVMSFASLGEGYSKVTDITTLAAGDKVVLYSDAAELGITGWDGNKTATAATDGWVEYVVETAEGGVLLQDGEKYIALTVKNSFSYNDTGSVCKVTADGILYITLEADEKDYLLYENANNGSPLYRMYVDKTGNSQYKPFYVYEVGEGEGETPVDPENPDPDTPVEPETPETPETPEGVITCAEALEICLATGETSTAESYTIRGYVTEIKDAYSEQYGNISYWMADAVDGGQVLLAYRVKPLNAGEENVKVGDFVEVVGTLVNYKGNTPEVNAGGKYTIITAGEGGDTPEQPETPETPETPEDVITCAEALEICLATGETSTEESYTIRGYVTEIKDAYSEQYGNISYWMADAVDGGQVLLAYRVKPLNAGEENVKVGDFVEVVGTLVNYKGNTPEVNAGGKYTIITAGEGGDTPEQPETGIEIKNLKYADAVYVEDAEYGDYWAFDLYNDYDYEAEDYVYPELYVMVNEAYSKTAINGTYNVLYSEYLPTADDLIITDEYAEDFVGTLTIKNVDSNGNYSFKGSFTANDGKTYTFNQTVEVYAYSYAEEDGVPVYEEIILNEGGTTPENPDPENPETPTGEVTFDADVDNEGIGTDSDNATAYSVTKDGVTMTVSSGILGTYNNENHYRVYKNQTLTITSTVGNIVEVEFTCTANDDEKYGPGCFTVSTGDYAYSGAVGTWTGSAAEVVFTATTNQVRATEIVVKVEDGTAVDDVLVENTPVKVIKNGQMYIIRGEKTYNVLGSFVK